MLSCGEPPLCVYIIFKLLTSLRFKYIFVLEYESEAQAKRTIFMNIHYVSDAFRLFYIQIETLRIIKWLYIL